MRATRIKLGELCHIVTKGTTPTSIGLSFSESGVPFLRIQNLSNRTVDLSNVLYVTDETNRALNRSRIQPKDFLITIAGTIGKVAIVPDDFPECNCNQAIAILRFDYERLDPQYLLHWLATNDAFGQISGKKVTATISNLSLGQIKELQVPLPPLAEQQQIAAILDAADSLRQKDQQLIDHYTALSQSLFLEMFGDPVTNPMGWKIVKLGDASDIVMGQSPAGDSYNDLKIGSPLLNGPTEFGEKYPIAKQWTTKPKKYCENDDLLFCVRGATAGKMNFADQEYCIGRGLAAIRVNGFKIGIDYIYTILKYRYDIFQSTSNGSTFINISKDDLSNVPIPNTSEVLQNQFAERITIIEQQKQQAQASLAKSEALFNSLLQRAFNGELTGNKAA